MGILVSDILYQTGLEVFVDVVGMVDSVEVFLVIGYWLFDVGIVDVVVEENLTCENALLMLML